MMDKAVGHKQVSGLQYRAIIEFVLKGANINLLSELTGVTERTIAQVSGSYKTELRKALENILSGSMVPPPTSELSHRGLMRCLFCGKYKDACSTNWMLIQIEGEDTKYLSCQECRGCNGEIKY